MTTENIQEILPSDFTITSNSENGMQLYLSQRYKDNMIAKYVFDIDYENQDINLNDFQEKYLSKDYFNSEGNLQWNYYLIFLRDKLPIEIKRDIEKDETYARKFVFTLNELKDYLNYEKATSVAEENVVEKWKAQLIEADLQEVFSNENYTDAVPRYLDNKSKKVEELQPIDSKPDETQDFILDEVLSLGLNDDYRDFPEKRNFDFGKVNLITGPNGVGKTSLMEAIELVITGNNVRNENNFPPPGAIKAKYGVNLDEQPDSYVNSIPKFKARNYYWYNTSYTKQRFNTLHHSFNRYNFYNSDSAYHLSNNASSNELTSYLTAIALGTEFGAIRDRIIGFRDRISKELDKFNNNILREEELKDEANKQKERLKKISDPDAIFQKYLTEAKDLKWSGFLPKTLDDETKKFEEDYSTAYSLLSSIVHSKVVKESDALKKLSNLETLKYELQNQAIKKKGFNDKIKVHQNSIIDKEGDLKLINNALHYFSDAKSFRIETIDEEIKTLERTLTKTEKFLAEIAALEITDINSSYFTIKELRKSQNEILISKNAELERSRKQLKVLKNALDKIKSLMVDIKYYGREYVEAKEEIDACPLCETPHTKEELKAKVQTKYEDKESAKSIEIFNKNISQLEDEISKITRKLNQLKDYEELLKSYYIEDELETKLSEIKILLNNESSQLDESKTKLDELKSLSLDLKLGGYDLDDFLRLKDSITSKYSDLIFKAENKSGYETLKNEIEKNIDNDRKKIEIEKEQLAKLEGQTQELLNDKYNSERYIEEIDFEIREYQSYCDYFSKLKTYIDFSFEDFIIEIRHSLERLNKTFESFKEQKVKFEQLNLANKLIKEAEVKIENLLPKKERAKSALKILNEILVEDSEEKVLGSFFKKNENEISEIFTSIHSPKEFSRLSFGSNKIVLYKKGTDTEVPISQISTGQRSALALSIFLALNKKLAKGPNVIIFDDPVTYTDDLNILSFLDYLRSIVINESRQIIFATASNKIANLFEKKFDFLNSDFKRFELTRTDK
ncbi:AAA family ATPase [Aequorivita sp. F47161]|uniref:AAA family ATPase n=1 Tax=Aequorivita vitellina TaxID=2874475 RepID=A0A9X1U2I1_9FLAO|nr:AAA family ATPase [Aequorivita vitellina]MCG2418262.1 AAA family ATPase [Aequorivita vitellina]